MVSKPKNKVLVSNFVVLIRRMSMFFHSWCGKCETPKLVEVKYVRIHSIFTGSVQKCSAYLPTLFLS